MNENYLTYYIKERLNEMTAFDAFSLLWNASDGLNYVIMYFNLELKSICMATHKNMDKMQLNPILIFALYTFKPFVKDVFELDYFDFSLTWFERRKEIIEGIKDGEEWNRM